MKKSIIIIVLLIVVVSLGLGFFFYKHKKAEELNFLRHKYEPLNSLNLKEIPTMASDKFDVILKLFEEYSVELNKRSSTDKEFESIVPNYSEIRKVIAKVAMKRDMEKKNQARIKWFRKNYSQYLREVKGIKDEALIKQEAEKYKYSSELGEEEEKEFDKFLRSLD